MNTDKQKAIEKAYGEHWETVKYFVDEDGWIDGGKGEDPEPLFDPWIGILEEHETENKFRPKSLQGIEENRGWKKIESEEDLPKETDGLWEVIINGKPKFIELLNANRSRLFKDFVKDGVTHYKIINHSELPIF